MYVITIDFHFKTIREVSAPEPTENLELSMNWQRNARPRENRIVYYITPKIVILIAVHFSGPQSSGHYTRYPFPIHQTIRCHDAITNYIYSNYMYRAFPIIYLAFKKKQTKKTPSLFIYLITQKVDLYSYTVL